MPIAPATPSSAVNTLSGYAHTNSSYINGDWCFIAWLKPYAFSADGEQILRVNSSLSLQVIRPSVDRFQINVNGSPSNFTLDTTAETFNDDEWVLLAGSYNSTSKTLHIYARGESSSGVATKNATIASFSANNGTNLNVMSTGVSDDEPFDGELAWVIRSHQLSANDFNTLWSRKRFTDPIWGDYHGGGVFENLPGPTNDSGTTPLVVSIGFCMSNNPTDDVTGSPSEAYPGVALSATNIIVYDRLDATGPTSMTVARDASPTGLVYTDPFGDGFFNRNPPGIFSGDQQVTGYAPLMRKLADNELPTGVKRVVCVANSRGMRANQSANSASGAYFYGLQQVRTSLVAGVSNSIGGGTGAQAVPKGTVTGGSNGGLASSLSGRGNFTRLGTMGASANPGGGACWLLTASGDTKDLAWGELSGSQYLDATGVKCRAILAKYPNSAGATFTPITAATNTGTRSLGSADTVSLNNTTAEATVVSVSGTTTVVSGDITGDIQAGDLVVGASGSTPGGINQVVSAVFGGVNTTITTKFTWDTAPSASDVVRFGPLEYVAVEVEHAGSVANYRGIQIAYNASEAGLPVCIVSWQTEISSGNGFALGGYGTGGEGWVEQEDINFDGMHGKLVAALGIDLAVQFPAQQGTSGSDLSDWLALFNADSPSIETVLAGDPRHPEINGDDTAGFVEFHSAMRTYANANNLAFATVIEDALLGSGIDLLCAGGYDDSSHMVETSIEAMWTRLLAMYETAASPKPVRQPYVAPRNRSRRGWGSLRAFE